MKSSIDISTRRSLDGRYTFIDRMLISIENVQFGNDEGASTSGVVVGGVNELLKNIEKQKTNIDFAQRVFFQNLSETEFFHLLHEACWETGNWPKSMGYSSLPPSFYFGLPVGSEIFDADEAYFVVLSLKRGMLFARNKMNGSVFSFSLTVVEYVEFWKKISAEISRRENLPLSSPL
jgi:hypothetical protein